MKKNLFFSLILIVCIGFFNNNSAASHGQLKLIEIGADVMVGVYALCLGTYQFHSTKEAIRLSRMGSEQRQPILRLLLYGLASSCMGTFLTYDGIQRWQKTMKKARNNRTEKCKPLPSIYTFPPL